MKMDTDDDHQSNQTAGIMHDVVNDIDIDDAAADNEYNGYTDEEGGHQHDQLPSAEEYKAKLRDNNGVGRISSSSSNSRAGLFTFLGLLLFVIIITSIAVPLALNKNKQDPYSESSSNKKNKINNEEPVTPYFDDDVTYTTPVASPTHPPVTIVTAPPPSDAAPVSSLPLVQSAAPVGAAVPPASPPVSTTTTTTIDPERLEKTFAYLLSSGAVARQLDLENTDTPQGKAARWIAIDDGYQLAIPSDGTATATRFLERWSLAVLYYSTGGGAVASWRYQLNFLDPIDHCNWYETFIDTSGSIVRMGVTQCKPLGKVDEDEDADDMVARIELSNNRLTGTLPKEIQYLTRMEDLMLPFNANLVDNSSLNSLTPLSRLKHLELQYCGIAGTIPDDFSSLGALTFLGLGNNFLTGSIPKSFFQLTNLNVLGLDDNVLESPIGPFANFTNMEKLYIEDNLFSGMVTADMITNGWQKMIDLDASENMLVGPLPSNIWLMGKLEVLDLHGNKFIGAIPEIDRVHEQITFVSLQNNTLDWRLPEGINKLVNLAHLDISSNNMVVPFPSTMDQMSNLRSLYTGANNFDANPFPTFLEGMTNLRELSMKRNKLTGPIPTFIGGLTSLKVLDLDFNQLEGTLPSEMGQLTGINTLMLNRNEGLTGTIPSSFSSLENLDILLLDGTDLSGTADVICNTPTINTTFFAADCAAPDPELTCSCCHLCCSDTNTTCNNFDWKINLDGIWEYDFQRVVYQFSQNLVPESAP